MIKTLKDPHLQPPAPKKKKGGWGTGEGEGEKRDMLTLHNQYNFGDYHHFKCYKKSFLIQSRFGKGVVNVIIEEID